MKKYNNILRLFMMMMIFKEQNKSIIKDKDHHQMLLILKDGSILMITVVRVLLLKLLKFIHKEFQLDCNKFKIFLRIRVFIIYIKLCMDLIIYMQIMEIMFK